jgi:ariadne-1
MEGEEDYGFSEEEDYYYADDGDSHDGLADNDDSALQWAPPKGSTTKVCLFSVVVVFV